MLIQNSAASIHWNQIGIKHHHGINIPLFSLRSKKSSGIGEFPDLIPLIDWCASLNIDMIQLLPLNDTGKDTSPYNALSAYALNPIHIGLDDLLDIHKHHPLKEKLKELKELNLSQWIDYEKLARLKDQFLRTYFFLTGDHTLLSPSFHKFIEKNESWIYGYALFKALKLKYDWKSWQHFGELATFHQELKKNKQEVNYQLFLQYLAYDQLSKVKKYALAKSVWIKGDIPILVSYDSADVWQHRNLFLKDLRAGAPPDQFSLEGQSWGFPIYNWDKLEKTNFQWWRQRLEYAEEFYTLYRLDHVVGFFRIWAVPPEKKASEGHFIPQEENQWIPQGKKLMLMMLASSSMLPIGEDLGVVPPPVKATLKELGIAGTKVMRWERYWDTDKSFIHYFNYPQESMTTVSTHDSETLFMWWFNQVEEAKAFANFKGWKYTTELTPEYHKEILYDSHRTSSLFHINLLSEYLMLIEGMHWLNPEEERINVPGVISPKNWSYRFKPTVEEIIESDLLRDLMTEMIP